MAKERIRQYVDAFKRDGARITENLDFEPATVGRLYRHDREDDAGVTGHFNKE